MPYHHEYNTDDTHKNFRSKTNKSNVEIINELVREKQKKIHFVVLLLCIYMKLPVSSTNSLRDSVNRQTDGLDKTVYNYRTFCFAQQHNYPHNYPQQVNNSKMSLHIRLFSFNTVFTCLGFSSRLPTIPKTWGCFLFFCMVLWQLSLGKFYKNIYGL